jgi:hypothetical protein
MSDSRSVPPAGAMEVGEVLKRSYFVLLKDVAVRVGIFGGLFLAVAGLQQVWDSALTAVLLVPRRPWVSSCWSSGFLPPSSRWRGAGGCCATIPLSSGRAPT